jgi:FtsH-binding integral membrane protein
VFGFAQNEVLMSAIGALTFCGFIVYDTKRITDGTHPEHSLQSHQYIIGALELYLDIINLFIYLLKLFGERED